MDLASLKTPNKNKNKKLDKTLSSIINATRSLVRTSTPWVGSKSFVKLFLGLWLTDILGNNVAIWGGNVGVIILDGVGDFKPKFLIEIDGIFIVRLHMQVDLHNILLRTEIKNMIQQLCTCTNPRASNQSSLQMPKYLL